MPMDPMVMAVTGPAIMAAIPLTTAATPPRTTATVMPPPITADTGRLTTPLPITVLDTGAWFGPTPTARVSIADTVIAGDRERRLKLRTTKGRLAAASSLPWAETAAI